MIDQWVSLQSIGYNGQPVQQAFRRVDPPVAVRVDLAALFPREPHGAGGYNPAGLQMHSVVDGRLTCWGICEQGNWWGLVNLRDCVRGTAQVRDPLDPGVDAQAEDGLGATRLGYSSLRFAARDPQPPGQHICPRRPAEQGGVALGDQLPDQPAVQGRHFLVEVLKPAEE